MQMLDYHKYSKQVTALCQREKKSCNDLCVIMAVI